jgi:ribulose-phosphate 3-epimerase
LKVKIAPSILAGDQANLKDEVTKVEVAGADMIHVDVSDGHFAPNISMGPDTVKSLRQVTRLPLDVHLMIEEPEKFLDQFLDAGSDVVTVHAEVVDEKRLHDFSRKIHSRGKKLGLAMKPSTPLPSWVRARLDDIDLLLILSVNPGFSGQQFMASVLPKLAESVELVGDRGLEIEVDGGVDQKNAAQIVKAGATVLVAGASIFRRGDVKTALHEMRDVTERTIREVPA